MKLKELKFLIRQIVREEIINLVKEKEVSLSPPKTIFVKEKSILTKKIPKYKKNPFRLGDEDYYDFSSGDRDFDILKLKENLKNEKDYYHKISNEISEEEDEEEEKIIQESIETNTLEDKIENEDTSHLKAKKDIFNL